MASLSLLSPQLVIQLSKVSCKIKHGVWSQNSQRITFILPAFLENMLTGGPLLGGAPGPPGPGILGIAGKPEGGGGGGLIWRIIKKTFTSELVVWVAQYRQEKIVCLKSTIQSCRILQHYRPPLQARSSRPISASVHPTQSDNYEHSALISTRHL